MHFSIREKSGSFRRSVCFHVALPRQARPIRRLSPWGSRVGRSRAKRDAARRIPAANPLSYTAKGWGERYFRRRNGGLKARLEFVSNVQCSSFHQYTHLGTPCPVKCID